MVLGIQSGTLVWGVLTSVGVTALLTASHFAYEALRWGGAAYLVGMGGGLLWTSWRRSAFAGGGNDGGFGDPFEGAQDLFDLGGVDVLAAAQDEVLPARPRDRTCPARLRPGLGGGVLGRPDR
ncbi:LysE family transporter [Streptomyces avermitilis]|uniref:LysE family transporter n=1 Tax=Streptomyces avermitilis TaxID=33903 RepID=UPI0033A021A7